MAYSRRTHPRYRRTSVPPTSSGPKLFPKVKLKRNERSINRSKQIDDVRHGNAHHSSITPERSCVAKEPPPAAGHLLYSKARACLIKSTSDVGSAPNIFLDAMLIHVPCKDKAAAPSTMCRRCLFDTGADLNVMSYSAWKDLRLPVEAGGCLLEGIGGSVNVPGFVRLKWSFQFETTKQQERRIYSDIFYVLPTEHEGHFDCVIGWQFIQQHPKLFIKLISHRISQPSPE